MRYLLILLSFIVKVYSFNQNIIVLPTKIGVFAHIKTKDSFINFYSKHVDLEIFGFVKSYEEYIFQGSKNLTSIDSYDDCPINLDYIDKKNNIFKLTSGKSNENFLTDAVSIFKFFGLY